MSPTKNGIEPITKSAATINPHNAIGNGFAAITRRISTSDLYYALARGYDDFAAFPSHAVFLCVIYPLLGILLIGLTSGAIIALSLLLMAIYLIWLVVAYALYIAIFGYSAPTSIEQFISDVLTTPRGWTLIIVGTGIGFLFAALVLSISAISFPVLLDRDVGARVASCREAKARLNDSPLSARQFDF